MWNIDLVVALVRLVKEINNINMASRWNIIEKLLSDVTEEDFNFLLEHQKEKVGKFFLKQSGRYNAALNVL